MVESMELLDYLSAKAGCMYLSDLHRVNNFLAVHHALRELPPDTFSVKEWNDAVRYITGEQHDFFLIRRGGKVSCRICYEKRNLINYIFSRETGYVCYHHHKQHFRKQANI